MRQFEEIKTILVVFTASAVLFFAGIFLFTDKRIGKVDDLAVVESENASVDAEDKAEPVDEILPTSEEPIQQSKTMTVADPDPMEEDPRALAQLIKEDRLCDAYLVLAGQAVTRKEKLLVLLKALDIFNDPQYPELSSELTPIIAQSTANYESVPSRTLVALRMGGMLKGELQPEFAGQERLALQMLESLSAADPTNGIYTYFQMALMSQQPGVSNDELIKKGFELTQATNFSAKFLNFYGVIEEKARSNFTSWILAKEILEKLPRPDYSKTVPIIDKIDESVPGLKQHLTRIMTIEGLNSTKSYRLYGYDVQQYQIGREFAGVELLPSVESLERQKGNLFDPSTNFDVDAANCSPEKLTQIRRDFKFTN